jgi:hypothetical protein
MRQVRPQKNQIAWTVVSNAVADQSLSGTVDNQSQLKLRVIVPVKREFHIDPFKSQQ